VDEYQRVLVHPSVAARADGEHHPQKDPAPGPAHISDVSDRAVGSAVLDVQPGAAGGGCSLDSTMHHPDLHGTRAHALAAFTGGAVRTRRAGGKLIVKSTLLTAR
jgi:hypothetical protein